MLVEPNTPLQAYNSFGISAKALQLVRVQSDADVLAVLADAALRDAPKFVLGGGSNIVPVSYTHLTLPTTSRV